MAPDVVNICIKELGDFAKIKIKERFEAMLNLQDSTKKLVGEMGDLRSYKNLKERKVIIEEEKNFRCERTDVVKRWLARVDELGIEVENFRRQVVDDEASTSTSEEAKITHQAAGDRGGGCCCALCEKIKPCCCRIKLSGEVADLIGAVRLLKKQGEEIEELVIELAAGKETYGTVMLGAGPGTALRTIREYLKGKDVNGKGNEVGIICIYGAAWVGKSHLLSTIKHEYTHERKAEFSWVIFAEVTRDIDMEGLSLENPSKNVLDIERLRNSIGRELDKFSPGWTAASLNEALLRGRFLLLLENVWEKLDLTEIGIPTPDPHNECKIVFTTRSRAVCQDMEATKVKLSRLTEVEAFELFQLQLSNDQLLFQHESEAREIVTMCYGIPIALKLMARVMSKKTGRNDWPKTTKDLRDTRTKFDKMEGEKVFRILTYSYYHLKAELRPCLLYCSLFVNNIMDIDRGQLIDYWLGEGFLDGDGGDSRIETARGNGRDNINDLVSACLLECSDDHEEDKVKMHGLIRDMSIKIAANDFLVYPDSITTSEEKGENWERARRISLRGSNVSKLPIKECPNLQTLLLNNCWGITSIPAEFFNQMSALRVLDLSDTRIRELPRGIDKLQQLRHLNLSRTSIGSLPKETGKMENLVQLNLSFTLDLETIPYEAIMGLSKLRTLNLFESKYRKWECDAGDSAREVSLSDLGELKKLEELALSINEYSGFAELLDSKVAESVVWLYLDGFPGLTPETQFEKLEKLQQLHIANILDPSPLGFERQWFLSLEALVLSSLFVEDINIIIRGQQKKNMIRCLSRVEISKCNNLADLSWIRHLVSLGTLFVTDCRKLKAVIASDDGHGRDEYLSFQRLKVITLTSLPNLKSFCKCTVTMACAPSLTVRDCPLLTGEFVYCDRLQGGEKRIPFQNRQDQVTGSC